MNLDLILGGALAIAMYVNYRLARTVGRKDAEKKQAEEREKESVRVKESYELAVKRMEDRVTNFEKRLSSIDIALVPDAQLNQLWQSPTADFDLPTNPESDQKSETK